MSDISWSSTLTTFAHTWLTRWSNNIVLLCRQLKTTPFYYEIQYQTLDILFLMLVCITMSDPSDQLWECGDQWSEWGDHGDTSGADNIGHAGHILSPDNNHHTTVRIKHPVETPRWNTFLTLSCPLHTIIVSDWQIKISSISQSLAQSPQYQCLSVIKSLTKIYQRLVHISIKLFCLLLSAQSSPGTKCGDTKINLHQIDWEIWRGFLS